MDVALIPLITVTIVRPRREREDPYSTPFIYYVSQRNVEIINGRSWS
jgi:hypothetical protein